MLEKMKEIIAEQLNCDAESITPETSFKEDLGADSCSSWLWLWKMNILLRFLPRNYRI